MNKKLYVGGLSWNTTEDELREAFSEVGRVESAWIKVDRDTGRSGGFGFVEMATEEEAQAAIDMWNGKELDGRNLTVNEARPQEERSPRQGGYNRSGGNNRSSGNNRY